MKVNTVIAIAVGLSTLLGTAFTIDSRYAKTDYVEQIDKRLELKILKDRANALQERMWKIEDRYGMEVSDMPEDKRDQYRKLKKEYDEIMKKIDKD
jgi:hypothetical protein